MPDSFDPEDALLRRLREGAGGETASRQLQRRYDELRADYQRLIGRLGELEERLTEPPAAHPDDATSDLLATSLLGPLVTLRDQYAVTLGGLQALVSGLDGLAAGAFKAQRGPGPADADGAVAAPRSYQVETKARTFPALLEFQSRLAAVPGVSRVAIHAIDAERATFVVELGGE